jgi:hypothetical protein
VQVVPLEEVKASQAQQTGTIQLLSFPHEKTSQQLLLLRRGIWITAKFSKWTVVNLMR